jgi:hypothetical protein
MFKDSDVGWALPTIGFQWNSRLFVTCESYTFQEIGRILRSA